MESPPGQVVAGVRGAQPQFPGALPLRPAALKPAVDGQDDGAEAQGVLKAQSSRWAARSHPFPQASLQDGTGGTGMWDPQRIAGESSDICQRNFLLLTGVRTQMCAPAHARAPSYARMDR